MRCKALLRHVFLWTLGLFAGLSPLAFAEAVSPQEQIQVHASRATSSLMLLRGEGFQKVHQQRLDADLAALAGAMQSLPQGSAELTSTQLIRHATFAGPRASELLQRYACPYTLNRNKHAAR